MPKLDDVYCKIGNALKELLATRGVGGEFDAPDVVTIYESKNPGDRGLNSQDGGHDLDGYLNGMVHGYMGVNNKNNGRYGPKIKQLGPKRYQFE